MIRVPVTGPLRKNLKKVVSNEDIIKKAEDREPGISRASDRTPGPRL